MVADSAFCTTVTVAPAGLGFREGRFRWMSSLAIALICEAVGQEAQSSARTDL